MFGYFQEFITPAVALGTKPKLWSSFHIYARVFLSPLEVTCYMLPSPLRVALFIFRLSSMTNSSGLKVCYCFLTTTYVAYVVPSFHIFFFFFLEKKAPMIALIWSILRNCLATFNSSLYDRSGSSNMTGRSSGQIPLAVIGRKKGVSCHCRLSVPEPCSLLQDINIALLSG